MYKKILLTIVVGILSMNMSVFAAESRTIVCTTDEATKKDFAEKQGGPDLETTSVFDSLFGAAGGMSYLLANNNVSAWDKCTAQKIKRVADADPDSRVNVVLDSSCFLVGDETCADMGLLNDTQGNGTGYNTRGGLLGFASTLEIALKDPIPLNLAYYVNQNVQKIPLLKNTAFAATNTYGGPFLESIYRYWTLSRNIAYAFLAMAMMVIGILIITRQKIDAKASVTVQQALPQIVIALILITFSYPIGATGASLAYNIKGNLESRELITMAGGLDVSSVASVNGFTLLKNGLGGIFAVIMGLISTIIGAVMGIAVLLKMFGIYIKMLVATVTAPLVFALGAIPGNQNTTMNWFKQYASYAISLPAIAFIAGLIYKLIWDISLNTIANFDALGGWGLGILAGIALPIITYYGFTIALSVPEKIDEMFGIKGKKYP